MFQRERESEKSEMDSEEEFLSFSDTENLSSPVRERKLKRLRKAAAKFPKDPPNNDSPPIHAVNLNPYSEFESLDTSQKNAKEDCEEPNLRSGSHAKGFKEVSVLDSGCNTLRIEEGGPSVKRALEFNSLADESDGKTDSVEMEEEEKIRDLKMTEESEKKRRNLNEFKEKKEDNKKKKKKRSKRASDGYDDEPYSVASNRRRENKGRRQRLEELRAESQRLLRETRDASFKPVLLVQKPISSILEKIRKRKLEVSKKWADVNGSYVNDDNDSFSREVTADSDFEDVSIEDKEGQNKTGKADSEEPLMPPVDVDKSLDIMTAEKYEDAANQSHENLTSQLALDEEPRKAFRAPVDGTQDLVFDSHTSDSRDDLLDETPSSPLEEALAPSLLAMNLKLDSAPSDDSSDEEDNDKENVDPHLHGSAVLSASPKGDPMKAFVDEEAEEEDDSDHDLHRFQDNEEDEDIMDSEELNDMIATGYEEKLVDKEMRNELHQKWLEQQDAAGTENLLQRLRFGRKHTETTLLEDKANEEGEDEDEEFVDEAAEYFPSRNIVRMNLKKAKEMIPQMFTDKDDVYLSSDDEETDKRLVKDRFSNKADEETMLMPPAEDEGSKEIFSLIKKLNGVPDTRKKARITSYFHMLSIGGNRTMPSKSSFLGWASKSALPSFQKHGSSTVRSFIFERDDSNSRSAVSMPEDFSDPIQRDNRPRKTTSAKFSNSQIRSTAQNTQTAAGRNSGPSLHEILRCPSLQSSHCNRDSSVGQVEAIYAAFKMDQNLIKKEHSVSIRTV